uniref:Low-density lipoprotein receptor-related protein 6 n=1 Tax=Magallana gigas TaxID=29159 RepID=K1QLD4_MAGGI
MATPNRETLDRTNNAWPLLTKHANTGFPPQIPYLFWTVNTNQLFYLNNTENWIRQNEPPKIFRFSYGDSKHKHLGCSYDLERNYLLFSDNSANTISLLGVKSNGGLQGAYVHIGTSSGVGHVAVDWISSNVYWSDSLFGWIGLQALPKNIHNAAFNRKFKVVVDKFLDIPSGLAVHTSKRFLFWTDTGIQPKIERSLLDGSKRKVLVWSGILYPVSIAVDVHSNTIYFTDSARETVESCDLEGNARRILFYETNSVFYGIETFKNYVIVSDQTSNRILVLSNSTGQKMVTPLRTSSPPFSLGLVSQDNQPIGSTDCDTFGCSQICIIESSGARCLCEDGYSLLADGKTCTGLDYDWVTDTVYWSEESVAKIFYWNVSSDRVANTGEITVPGLGIPKALKIDPFKIIETLENYDISNPIFLHFDRRKDTVFWSDNGRSSLGSDYLLWLSNTHSNHSLNVQENTTLGSDTIIKMPLGVVAPRVLDLRVFDRALQPSVREPCITDNDGCQHICIVEGESSQCACHVGYTLQSDRKSCLSAPVASNFLLTTDIQIKGIYQINLENKNISAVDVLAGNPNIPDYDNVRRKLVWWDKSKNTIMESSLDGTDGKAVKGGVRNVGGLVIDHSTGNIFYASDNNIYVTTSSGNVYRKLLSGVNIGSLQVDSKRGIMVWIEGRPNPKIIRSYMDGTNVETIISNSTHSISTPMDLAIDNSDGSLVWCDDTLDKIDIVSMITLTSRTVISNRGEYPVSVAVLGEFIYYIARDRRSITKISKITGSKPDDVVSSPLFGKLLYLTIYEESKSYIQCPLVINHGRIRTTCRRLTGDVCEFTCNEGYQLGVPETTMLLCGSNGKWNQTSELCKVKDKGNTDAIIGGVAGSAAGLVLIIVIIVAVVCMRIRKKKKRDSENQPINVSYVCPSVSGSVLSTSQISTYTTLTDDRESVYSEIREEFDQPKTVEIPPIHDKNFKEMGVDIQKGSSIRSERYSIFPGKNADEGGYLEACHVGNSNDFLPVPDYEHDDWLEPSPRNGYLDAVGINDHFGNPKRKDDARFKHPYE